ALLIPDGRIIRGGKDGQFQRAPYKYFEHRLELFSPPYVFATRPQIVSAPATGAYGQHVAVGCPAAGDVAAAALIRAGSVTHGFHMDQRYVGLEIISTTASQLTVKLPPNGNVAPPGAYMLFLRDSGGTPSRGRMIKVG
ncbi:MAG: hypothetical protein QOG59_3694, partial [Solirubrobacteraceae bacterium]|nr:hypothetical protein [Solirubrobacteraceae bacterium]